MPGQHVSEEQLERFLRLAASRDEASVTVRHLLTGCTECFQRTRRLVEERRRRSCSGSCDVIFERVTVRAGEEEQRLARERLRAPADRAYLEPMDPDLRSALVDYDASFHSVGLYEQFLEASRCVMRSHPAKAAELARLAIVVAERLDPTRFTSQQIADFRASAWAALGNAKRLASDFEGARGALSEAWRALEEEGTNDPLEQAHLMGLTASYLNDQGELEKAEATLGKALVIYRRAGDAHLQGRTLLKMGDMIGRSDPERGIAHLRKGLTLIDIPREPRLELCARHDLAWFLNDSGRVEEALRTLDRARPLYHRFEDPYTQLRLRWLEARIALRRGELKKAEVIFRWLFDEFQARNLDHELVVVSIDLAEVVAKRRPVRATELLAQCYAMMQAWGLHRHALAILILHQRILGRMFTAAPLRLI